MIHKVPGGHTYRQDADGSIWMTDDSAEEWSEVDQALPIVIGEMSFSRIPLKGMGTHPVGTAEVLWLSCWAGMEIKVLGEAETYIVARKEAFLGDTGLTL